MNFRTILFLCSVAFFTHCGGSSSDQPIPTDSITTPPSTATESQIIIELADGVTMNEALSVISTDGVNPEADMIISWNNHIAKWSVPTGSIEDQKTWLITQETTRLEELKTNLEEDTLTDAEEDAQDEIEENDIALVEESEEDPDSTNSLEDVATSLNTLYQTNEAPIGYIIISSDLVSRTQLNDSVVLSIKTTVDITNITTISENQSALHDRAVYDFYDDYYYAYIPKRGYSKLTENATYQSFKIRKRALNAFRAIQGAVGLEIKTLIYGRDNVECGDNWSTNLPYKTELAYLDTEAFDNMTSPEWRICSIGTIDAKLFKPKKNYWVKREMVDLKTINNPTIQVQWAPTKYCDWNETFSPLCSLGDFAWCMCSRDDMPIQTLLQYDYNDANGGKVRWERNYYPDSHLAAVPSEPNPDEGDFTAEDSPDSDEEDLSPTTPSPEPTPTPPSNPDSSYTSLDLTSQAPVAYSDLATKPFSYTNPATGELFVVFNGSDHRIYELIYNGATWSSTDLSAQAAVPYAASGTSPMGFTDELTGSRYVVFNGENARIQMLTWNGSVWSSTDLTGQAAVPYSDLNAEPFGYIDSTTGYIHVLFNGNDRRIYEFTYNGATWSSTDLSAQAAVPYAASGTSPMGFTDELTGSRYVVFNGENARIQMFTRNEGLWSSTDLSAQAAVAYSDLGSEPFGYTDPATGDLFVTFNGNDKRIYELRQNNSTWFSTDLSAQDSVPYAEVGTSPTAYVDQLTGERIVLFMGDNHRVQQFLNNGTNWTATDLTSQAPVPYGASGTGVSGCYNNILGSRYAIFNGDNARINMLRFGQ